MISLVTAPELLTMASLAELLGIPVRTLSKWNSTGTGPRFIRMGKHVRYHRADVEAWLNARRSAA